MTFNFSSKQALQSLKSEIDNALIEVAAKNGITIRCGNLTYSDTAASIKLECTSLSESGEVMSKHRASFMDKRTRTQFGLLESDLGATIQRGKTQYRLDGLMPTRGKPIVMARVPDGKVFVFDTEVLEEIISQRQIKKTS